MSLGLANPESRTETLTNDLAKIGEWAKLRKVKFSEEKTEPLSETNNVVFEEKPHQKYLGITLQNNCKWDEHINNLSSKVSLLINCCLLYTSDAADDC